MIIAPRLQDKDNIYLAAGDQFGSGWWGDRWKNVKTGVSKAAKAVQSPEVAHVLARREARIQAAIVRQDAELAQLAAVMAHEWYEDGEEIITQGDAGDSVFFLRNGQPRASPRAAPRCFVRGGLTGGGRCRRGARRRGRQGRHGV